MHSDLHLHFSRATAERHRHTAPRAFASTVALRLAHADESAAVERLAALDSVAPLEGPVLLALADGEPVAALALDDGRVAADPFAPTATAVELLQVRARQGGRRLRAAA
jgi:hypothetical protein